MALLCLGLRLLLLGQDGLQHISRLGDTGEIDLGRNALGAAGALRTGLPRSPRTAHKLRAHLLGLIFFQRTGVSLAGGQAELCQYVENLTALDLHLAREIIDTNLTHPPLFNWCYPKPLVAHSYPMALAVLKPFVIV
jgi:hypothetical protein